MYITHFFDSVNNDPGFIINDPAVRILIPALPEGANSIEQVQNNVISLMIL